MSDIFFMIQYDQSSLYFFSYSEVGYTDWHFQKDM